jgi:hypothetical protein
MNAPLLCDPHACEVGTDLPAKEADTGTILAHRKPSSPLSSEGYRNMNVAIYIFQTPHEYEVFNFLALLVPKFIF